jgi:hypothetical protein
LSEAPGPQLVPTSPAPKASKACAHGYLNRGVCPQCRAAS